MYFHQKDSATPVVDFIAAEMSKNVRNPDAAKLRSLNSSNMTACISEWQSLPLWRQLLGLGIDPQECAKINLTSKSAAYLGWALNVRQDGPWDHKPVIRRTYNAQNPGGEQVYHRLGLYVYFYDVWSNIHYGYVGRACGFSRDALLDGAGLEQMVSDPLAGYLPERAKGVTGPRAFDHPEDRVAITIGMDLYEKYPGAVTGAQVKDAVLTTKGLDKWLFFRPRPKRR